jgi:hypothetical protein
LRIRLASGIGGSYNIVPFLSSEAIKRTGLEFIHDEPFLIVILAQLNLPISGDYQNAFDVVLAMNKRTIARFDDCVMKRDSQVATSFTSFALRTSDRIRNTSVNLM